MRCILLRMVVAFLAMLTFGARAAEDWIDELPSVTTVAYASTEELKVTTADWKFDARGIALKDDDDLAAVTLVGTLVLMRKIMLYKYNQEKTLPRERETKLRAIAAAYLEAELLIGKATGNRRGYLTTAHRCGNIDCYRRWFANDISNIYISAEYRARILKRLYPCGERAAELDQLAQSHGLRAPFLPSPAVTLSIPPEIAGVGPSGCTTYGGDANRNGLCDDWEKPPSATAANSAKVPAGTPIALAKLHTLQGGGLRVTLAKDSAQPGTCVRFRVKRAVKPSIDAGAVEVWSGEAVIQSATQPDAAAHAIVAPGIPFEPNEASPFLLVEATSGPSAGPVSCEQPLTKWLQRQLDAGPDGLHGPYARADVAALSAASIALHHTNAFECGFLIGRDMRSAEGGYYTSPPTCGTKSDEFPEEDYRRSLKKGFANSCEEQTNFALAGSVHTHPKSPVAAIDTRNDYFSMLDFDGSVEQKKNDNNFEKIYMISKHSGCVEAFAPKSDDRAFTFSEKYVESVGGAIPAFAPLYLQYVERMETIKCF